MRRITRKQNDTLDNIANFTTRPLSRIIQDTEYLPTDGEIQGNVRKRQEMWKKHKYCNRFSQILKIEFAPILNNQEQVGWGKTRFGIEKRFCHNLQGVQLVWWSADNCSILNVLEARSEPAEKIIQQL